MRSIYVVERNDRQRFALPLSISSSISPANTMTTQVLGVGFASQQEADDFLHIVGSHQDFHIDHLVEGGTPQVPMPGNQLPN